MMRLLLATATVAIAFGCASPELKKSPVRLSTLGSLIDGGTTSHVIVTEQPRTLGLELSTRVRQPECLDVPDTERDARRCICGWGSTCLCRVRVRQTTANSCLIQSMTEYEDGVPKFREPDGRVREVVAARVERAKWARDVVLGLDSSTSVCGLTITCVADQRLAQ